jgi:hypothetical protein
VIRRTRFVGLLIALCSALFTGCLRSTDPQPSNLQLTGDWVYTGVQSGAVRENLSGELSVLGQSANSFQGRLDIVGVNEATGESRVMGGPLSGIADGDVIDFDANIEATTRRHVGQLVDDTITGTWVASSAGGAMSSGTFRAERVRNE